MKLYNHFFFLTFLFIFLSYQHLNAQYSIDKNPTKLEQYKPFQFNTLTNHDRSPTNPDTLRSKQKTILLNEVTIYAEPTYKADSLTLRKDFSSIFDYKGPTLKSVFSNTSSSRSANSTSSILTLDVLKVISLFGKKTDKTYKLQQLLLKEEKERHIDHIFSKGEIQKLTELEDDSLTLFIEQYRPGIHELKNPDEYSRLLYIKKSLAEFKKKKP